MWQNLSMNSREKIVEMERRISDGIWRVEKKDYKLTSTHST